MSRKCPNTDHWQRIAKALDRLAGKSWRRYGEGLFELPRGGLRAHIDRIDIAEAELIRIEDLVAAEFRELIADQLRYIEDAQRAADTFDSEVDRRRFDVRQAAKEAYHDEVDALIHQALDWQRRHMPEAA